MQNLIVESNSINSINALNGRNWNARGGLNTSFWNVKVLVGGFLFDLLLDKEMTKLIMLLILVCR